MTVDSHCCGSWVWVVVVLSVASRQGQQRSGRCVCHASSCGGWRCYCCKVGMAIQALSITMVDMSTRLLTVAGCWLMLYSTVSTVIVGGDPKHRH